MKLLSELDKTSSILRDLLNGSFNRIATNDQRCITHIKGYLKPSRTRKIVSYHKGS